MTLKSIASQKLQETEVKVLQWEYEEKVKTWQNKKCRKLQNYKECRFARLLSFFRRAAAREKGKPLSLNSRLLRRLSARGGERANVQGKDFKETHRTTFL